MVEYPTYLIHYGTPGQKWYVRRWQNKDGSLTPEGYIHYGIKNLKKSKTANLDKWGKTRDTNVLYIAGYSGSGKSTTSVGLAKKGDRIIHLDGYTDGAYAPKESKKIQDKNFNEFLDKECPDWKKMTYATNDGSKGSLKRFSKEYWKIVDQFRDSIEKFGQNEFQKGKRCIVEGVQLADDWFTQDKSYFKDKPTIVMQTSTLSSMKRAFDRDQQGFTDIETLKEYAGWAKNYIDYSKIANTNLNNLSNAVNAKKNQKYMDDFIKQYGNKKLKEI